MHAQGPVTKVHALIGWDNKGTVQHMAKMTYMAERADRLEGLEVRCDTTRYDAACALPVNLLGIHGIYDTI